MGAREADVEDAMKLITDAQLSALLSDDGYTYTVTESLRAAGVGARLALQAARVWLATCARYRRGLLIDVGGDPGDAALVLALDRAGLTAWRCASEDGSGGNLSQRARDHRITTPRPLRRADLTKPRRRSSRLAWSVRFLRR